MQDMGSTRFTYLQTWSLPTPEHQEDIWRHNDTSERRDNNEWDDPLKIFWYTDNSKSSSKATTYLHHKSDSQFWKTTAYEATNGVV